MTKTGWWRLGVALPPLAPHSSFARPVAQLMWVTFAACGLILGLVCALVAICLVRFRKRPNAPPPEQRHGDKRLEIAWTVIPILIVTLLFGLSAWTMTKANPSPNRPPDLRVIAHQWWWDIRYLQAGVVTANEVHLPVGQKWLVQLESSDVIHDFWVPELAPKMDAIPGHPNFFWIEAEQPGTYLGTCAEYCGTQHAWMRLRVIADSRADFDSWVKTQLTAHPATQDASVDRGSDLFRQRTCISCHAIDSIGGRAAPDLTHLETRQTLGAGVLENNQNNLARWLTNAQLFKPGCHMPSLGLSEPETTDLAVYLEGPREHAEP